MEDEEIPVSVWERASLALVGRFGKASKSFSFRCMGSWKGPVSFPLRRKGPNYSMFVGTADAISLNYMWCIIE